MKEIETARHRQNQHQEKRRHTISSLGRSIDAPYQKWPDYNYTEGEGFEYSYWEHDDWLPILEKLGEEMSVEKFTEPDDLADVVVFMLTRPDKIWLNEIHIDR